MPYLYKTGHQYGNSTVNIIGKACLEVTQAQYDALSYAEKNDGTIYFVKDGEPESLIVNDSSPIGAIQAYGGDIAPDGWLICDGALVSRTTYSELFNVIGETYGAGDGNTTFNLPDLKGRVIIGEGTGTATDATAHSLGDVGGKETHTLDVTEMPSHNHSGSTLGWTPSNMGSGNAFRAVTDGSTNNTGGGLAHNNMQPYLVCNYIIKAKDTSTSETTILSMIDYFYPVGSYYETSDDTFDPNTTFGGTWELETEGLVHIGAGSNYTVGDTGGEETHKLTIDEIPSHDHTIHMWQNGVHHYVYPASYQYQWYSSAYGTQDPATSSTGGGQAHNNMQPYIVVNRWHRIA